MKLHAIYRSYGGENRKSRPAYYSKLLALASFVRAVDQLESPVGLTFLNDGPVANDAYRLMKAVGRVVPFDRLGYRGSYAKALTLAVGCNGDESDIVWLAEDDYLYRPDALERLLSAARLIPWASYFALYANFPTLEPELSGEDDSVAPRGWRDRGGATVHGHEWRHAVSTTSTFGARLPALRRDRQLFRMALYSARGWDTRPAWHTRGTCRFAVVGCCKIRARRYRIRAVEDQGPRRDAHQGGGRCHGLPEGPPTWSPCCTPTGTRHPPRAAVHRARYRLGRGGRSDDGVGARPRHPGAAVGVTDRSEVDAALRFGPSR